MDNTIEPQDGTNPESEVIEETAVEETAETPEVDEQPKEKTYTDAEFKQVLARAKAAEELLKKNKAPSINQNKPSLSSEDVDVKILKSQGMSDDLIKELQAVAKARNKPILDAVSDPIFIAIKNQKETDDKAKKAKLPASRSSGAVQTKEKNINSAGLTDAEHKALWKEQRDK